MRDSSRAPGEKHDHSGSAAGSGGSRRGADRRPRPLSPQARHPDIPTVAARRRHTPFAPRPYRTGQPRRPRPAEHRTASGGSSRMTARTRTVTLLRHRWASSRSCSGPPSRASARSAACRSSSRDGRARPRRPARRRRMRFARRRPRRVVRSPARWTIASRVPRCRRSPGTAGRYDPAPCAHERTTSEVASPTHPPGFLRHRGGGAHLGASLGPVRPPGGQGGRPGGGGRPERITRCPRAPSGRSMPWSRSPRG